MYQDEAARDIRCSRWNARNSSTDGGSANHGPTTSESTGVSTTPGTPASLSVRTIHLGIGQDAGRDMAVSCCRSFRLDHQASRLASHSRSPILFSPILRAHCSFCSYRFGSSDSSSALHDFVGAAKPNEALPDSSDRASALLVNGWRCGELNPGPQQCDCCALPTELHPRWRP